MASPSGLSGLRQPHALAGGHAHSPTKAALIVLPKPAVAPIPCKSKILPPLSDHSENSENCDRPNVLEVKPRLILRDRIAHLALQSKPKRHSVEPLPCDRVDAPSVDNTNDEPSVTLPPPMLAQAKRNVKKLS
jgi:hypothetical protein